ncbi:DUF2169 domain-containing protein [Variovorax sp. LjRoot290]|uniref:DUF2169 family type VI secretion system accessory protein n=1 Tax=Variovorax sp. LjRoot290 TaxID=3342316 RepID=UPI003ECF28CF
MMTRTAPAPPVPSTRGSGPGQAVLLPGQTPDGLPVLSVLVKRSFRFADRQRCVRADVDRKLVSGDQHYIDPMNSSVRFESDFVPWKLGTDVVLNARAYAPQGRAVQELVASVAVGDVRKDVCVVGDRVAHFRADADPVFSEPEPFEVMDIRYERAYGGVDIYSDRKVHCIYGRNHLGRGFVVANCKEAVEGLPLPNIEDPLDRVSPERLCTGHFMYWERQPMPEGFGWFSKHWRPRCLLAGVLPADKPYEEQLRAAYRRLIPDPQREMYDQTRLPDMDFRFYSGASRGLTTPYLHGDEVIRTRHLSLGGALAFQLPGDRPSVALDIGFGLTEPEVVLQTVMIRMDEREADLVWRAAVHYPGPDWLPQMRNLRMLVE